MKTLPAPRTVSPVKRTRPWSRQTLSAEWPGVPMTENGPTRSPSTGKTGSTPSRSAPSAWSAWEWVRTTPSSGPATAATRSRCPASAGPGSTTHRPTTHVFVPLRVIGDGFGATTRVMPGSASCTFCTGKRDTKGMAHGFGHAAADRRWALGAAAVPTVLAGVDAALSGAVLTGLLVSGPLIGALRSSVRATAFLAAYAVALGVVGGLWNDIFLETEHLTRLLALVIGAGVAIWVAELRE